MIGTLVIIPLILFFSYTKQNGNTCILRNKFISKAKFKRLRNEVTTLIRNCKQQHTDKITQKLKSENLSSKDWWSTLKAFISPHTHSDIPPLESNGNVYTNEIDKANLLNDHFQSQTILNEQNAILPPLPPPAYHTQLNSIILTPLEVESTLQTLKVERPLVQTVSTIAFCVNCLRN